MLKLLFAGLLALSLSLKVALGFSLGFQAAALADPALGRHDEAVAGFLERSGFTIEGWQGTGQVRLVSARAGACRVLVGALSPLSWHRDLLHRLAPEGGRAFFVYEGGTYEDQPRWRAWLRHYGRMSARLIGLAVADRPLYGVVTTPGCGHEVAWHGLDHPAR
ncbi:hypothetical protein [Methylobacterium nonmethylotrophicum]|uniref:Uncharacterized protein n=1 Tax=Methylobacterium nonmethylotrophicum TaxID=1141884 RepID=A0A4Z0NGR8_9HYPH|nr:hypothetical protein [Methylobacterium nonmethylotrophicum]TGD94850.1 hypothetical protein EU555_30840 [Methylobacterium nonmethylotrophicum]